MCCLMCFCFVFFFKQKTAYEMRISDWSSDVCYSDLDGREGDTVLEDLFRRPGIGRPGMGRGGGQQGGGEGERGGQVAHGPQLCASAVHPQEIGRASCRERVCQYV